MPRQHRPTQMRINSPQPEAARFVKEAFGRIEARTPDLDPTTDKLFLAAILAHDLEIRAPSNSTLIVKIAGADDFELKLALGVSTFRSVLARLAAICHAASTKRSLLDRVKAILRSIRILGGPYSSKLASQKFVYLTSSLRRSDGAHLYGFDSVHLRLRDTAGVVHDLELSMNNRSGNYYLKIGRKEPF